MPLQLHMKQIPVDDHLIEHPKVWSVGPEQVPADRSEDRRVERPDNGQMYQVWQYEGRINPYIGLNAVAGKKPEEYVMAHTSSVRQWSSLPIDIG
ncbi:MAG: hypothetical protein ACLP9Y_07115 [Mycobacterium sp.]